MPCGFCGQSGITSCSQIYLTVGKNPQAKGECAYAHSFYYKNRLESTGKMRCTNTPILCPIDSCTRRVGKLYTAVWKYNMPEHIATQHPGYLIDGYADSVVVPNLHAAVKISIDEHRALQVPDDHISQLLRQNHTAHATPQSLTSTTHATPTPSPAYTFPLVHSRGRKRHTSPTAAAMKRVRTR